MYILNILSICIADDYYSIKNIIIFFNYSKLTSNGLSTKHLFLEKCPPPSKPYQRNNIHPKEDLSPATPTIYVSFFHRFNHYDLSLRCKSPESYFINGCF